MLKTRLKEVEQGEVGEASVGTGTGEEEMAEVAVAEEVPEEGIGGIMVRSAGSTCKESAKGLVLYKTLFRGAFVPL